MLGKGVVSLKRGTFVAFTMSFAILLENTFWQKSEGYNLHYRTSSLTGLNLNKMIFQSRI